MNRFLVPVLSWWSGLEERERTLVSVGGAVVAFALLFFAVFSLHKARSRMENRVLSTRDQITRTMTMLREIEDIDAKLEGVQLPFGARCNENLFTALESLLRSCGAENISIRPINAPDSAYYTERAVEVEARRMYLKTLVGCLHQIDQSPSEYRAWKFQAKKRFDEPNMLDVRFQVSSFCAKGQG